MKIGIIGFGAAGISVLRELTKQLENLKDHTITVFSDETLFGTGLPYQKDDETLVLNQFAETMSVFPDDRMHFAEWIKKNKTVDDPLKKHFPRSWYGEYLRESAEMLLEKSQAKSIKQPVISVKVKEANRFTVATKETEETFDVIHLTTGHLAYQDPYGLKGTENYVHHPYPAEIKLSNISEDKHVGILGTGLTSVDLMLYLKKTRPTIDISFFSPDGKFGAVRGKEKEMKVNYFTKETIQAEKENNHGFISLDTIKEWFIKEIETQGINVSFYWNNFGQGTIQDLRYDLKHREEIGHFQSFIHSMTNVYADLWNGLTEKDRDRFLNDYSDGFTRFRSPLPSETIKTLLSYSDDDSANVYANISNAEKEDTGFRVELDSGDTIYVDYLLNGTGQTKDLIQSRHAQSELLQQLLNERILQPYPYGGVQILFPTMSAVSQRYGVLQNLKVYGQLVSGIDYMNNTVELISKSAVRGVESMIEWMDM